MLDLRDVAVAERSVPIDTVQGLVAPEQSPLHPVNDHPAEALAVISTLVPSSKFAEQVPGQDTPAGAEVTEPDPVTITESECWIGANVAVAERSVLIDTVQGLVVPSRHRSIR